ncbi:hypothetical protein [Saccharopolyspora hordei]|uniref:2-methylcitrate dehydratase PrpD n=1 Tax=Saccharopolyspora hordei TaxID=1838 RepID=A0A853AMA4_9PSEU|nr:hypothetical protein [Saccharopolyspora hordei]NYI84189.1 2-methylcitrate dehydratase PrpD [Saccharopolyspora hordei]
MVVQLRPGRRWFRVVLSAIVLGVVVGIGLGAWEPIAAMHPAYATTLVGTGAVAAVGVITGLRRRGTSKR